jgi:hypothetical protein
MKHFRHHTAPNANIQTIERLFGNLGYAVVYKAKEAAAAHDGLYLDLGNEPIMLQFMAECQQTLPQRENILSIMHFLADLGEIDQWLWQNRRVVCFPTMLEEMRRQYRRSKHIPTLTEIRRQHER